MMKLWKNKDIANAMAGALVALSMTAGGLANAEERPKVDDSPVNVTIAGYSSGGQVSVFGEGVVDAVRRTYSGSSIIYEPGNPAGALEYLKSERRPFALVSTVEPKWRTQAVRRSGKNTRQAQ